MIHTSRTAAAMCALLVAGALASGCRHKAPAAQPLPPAPAVAPVQPAAPPPPPPPPQARPPAPPTPLTEDQIFERKSVADLNTEAQLADALFDYDQSTIRPTAAEVLSQDAKWLTRWPTTRLTVEGHCDERGTAEYNLSLGERRATAVKSYLVSLGLAAERLTVVSYGKEQPVCTENSEQCWQRNRRAHLVITAK
jgi:peptidoglycan-associated lipoprotein